MSFTFFGVDNLVFFLQRYAEHCGVLQEKYRIKKQKKYAPRVLVRRPSARRLIPAFKFPFVILDISILNLLPNFPSSVTWTGEEERGDKIE